ncbi:MAG TPA: cyclic nucleotide-binding domain-containing protein [Actinomycetota bacterium]
MDAKRLEELPLFRDLSKGERERIARWADEVDVPAGYQLLGEGRLPHEFFVIEEGKADVTKGGDTITQLGPGDFFGEIALVEHERRTATVTAATPLTAIVMAPREFETMRQEMPEVCQRITDAIQERLSR